MRASGWELRGQATVRDVALDLGLPVAFTDTNGTFSLAGSSVHIDQLSGRAGGGEFSIGGSLDLNRGPAVSWSVHEVSLTFPEWLEERVSGKGQVDGTWKVITVGGDIEVLNALYDRQHRADGAAAVVQGAAGAGARRSGRPRARCVWISISMRPTGSSSTTTLPRPRCAAICASRAARSSRRSTG